MVILTTVTQDQVWEKRGPTLSTNLQTFKGIKCSKAYKKTNCLVSRSYSTVLLTTFCRGLREKGVRERLKNLLVCFSFVFDCAPDNSNNVDNDDDTRSLIIIIFN